MTREQTTEMFEAWCRAESRIPYDSADSRRHARALATVLLRAAPMPRWTDAGGREFWQFVAEDAMNRIGSMALDFRAAVEEITERNR